MEKRVKVLAIVSPKGGAGKTTTVANLAIALSNLKKYILALDTNITTASLGLHLDIINPPITFKDVLDKDFSILRATYIYNQYLHIIPTALSLELKYKPVTLQEKIRKLTNHYDILLADLANKYDLILIDSAPGFSVEAVSAMLAADALLIVTNPELPTIMVTAKAVEYAKYLKRPVIGIVLNRIKDKKYEITKEEIEEAIEAKVIAEIPEDPKVPESIADKTPIISYNNKSPASIAFKKLAANLLGYEYKLSFLERLSFMWNKFKN